MRAILCFHGLLSTKSDFSYLSTMLKNHYYKLISYDLPGHGQNKMKFNSENIKKFVVDMYDSIAYKYDSIDAIGYSMGGVIACYLQSVRRIDHLVLLAPAYRYLNLKNYHFTRGTIEAGNTITELFPRKNYFHIFRFTKIISDLSDEFKIIYPKTLILWGTDDYLVKEESGVLLYQMIHNKDRRFIKLKSHNHFNIVFSNTVLTIVHDFLV